MLKLLRPIKELLVLGALSKFLIKKNVHSGAPQPCLDYGTLTKLTKFCGRPKQRNVTTCTRMQCDIRLYFNEIVVLIFDK